MAIKDLRTVGVPHYFPSLEAMKSHKVGEKFLLADIYGVIVDVDMKVSRDANGDPVEKSRFTGKFIATVGDDELRTNTLYLPNRLASQIKVDIHDVERIHLHVIGVRTDKAFTWALDIVEHEFVLDNFERSLAKGGDNQYVPAPAPAPKKTK